MGRVRLQKAIRLEDVQAAGDVEGLRRLFEQLGFGEPGMAIPDDTRDAWGLHGIDPSELISCRVLTGHRGFRVLLLEAGATPGTGLIRQAMAGRLRADPAARELIVFAGPRFRELVFCVRRVGCEPMRLCRLLVRPSCPCKAEVEALSELAVEPGDESAAEIAFRFEEALDRERVTERFFRAFRQTLNSFELHLEGLPARAPERRTTARRFCLLTLNRILFLYFIQKKGWLNGDPAYLSRLFRRSREAGRPFFESLRVLFFGVMNTPLDRRTPEALALGRFPYLNGGLFEPDAVEQRYPAMRLGDSAFEEAFDGLFEKYRFTVREDPEREHEGGVDPEMLGKVFENLMDEAARGQSGSFYTPREVVARMVREALAAYLVRRAGLTRDEAGELMADLTLAKVVDRRDESTGDASSSSSLEPRASSLSAAEARAEREPVLEPEVCRRALAALQAVKVLDPAAGSGAFLLGMLSELARLQEGLARRLKLPAEPGWTVRRRILHRNLHGVDLEGTAVRLCDLRMWLALAVELDEPEVGRVPPLPNLDHRVKQGDSLLSPVDLAGSGPAACRERAGRLLPELGRLKDAYESAAGPAKKAAASALARREREVARGLLDWRVAALEEQAAGLEAMVRGKDLFGRPLRLEPRAARELEELRRRRSGLLKQKRLLEREGRLPSFSYEVHFAEAVAAGGFDIVIGNPPWVRLQRIPETARPTLRARYRCFREAAWRLGAALSGGSKGCAGQIDLAALFLERSLELARSGGIVSLLLPSKLFGALYGGGLRARLAGECTVLSLEDHSGGRERMFRADAFPAVLTVVKEPPARGHELRVSVNGASAGGVTFPEPQDSLPSVAGDPASPWLLAPPEVRLALERMRQAGGMLGTRFRPAMGCKTGRNCRFVVEACEEGPSPELVTIFSSGFWRPEPGRRRSAYTAVLERQAVRPLLRGEGLAPWSPAVRGAIVWPAAPGCVRARKYLSRHRAATACGGPAGPFLVWKDIAREMSAALVDGPLAGPACEGWPVPLNTVNLLEVSREEGLALTGLLNSSPARAFLASFAPRAKDGYFRFLCWNVALLPLPGGPFEGENWRRLTEPAARLHRSAGQDRAAIAELDRAAARLYGLGEAETTALEEWLRFLTGRPVESGVWSELGTPSSGMDRS
jgi:hypothetical protein